MLPEPAEPLNQSYVANPVPPIDVEPSGNNSGVKSDIEPDGDKEIPQELIELLPALSVSLAQECIWPALIAGAFIRRIMYEPADALRNEAALRSMTLKLILDLVSNFSVFDPVTGVAPVNVFTRIELDPRIFSIL